MADGHGPLKTVGQFFLERVFPEPAPGAVAAAAVGPNQQLRHDPVTPPAFVTPPGHNRIDRKVFRIRIQGRFLARPPASAPAMA